MGLRFLKFWSHPRPDDAAEPVFAPEPLPAPPVKSSQPAVLLTRLNMAVNAVARELPMGWRLVVSFERIADDVEAVVEVVGPDQTRYVVTSEDPTLQGLLLTALEEIKKKRT